jgi:pyruvate dehydrogenase E2 component (dihydrolipoamide acetyltransferase)
MTIESLTVPDLGGAEQVEVIEILVAAGDQVAAEEGIIVLETDKATMEIPSPFDGTISSLSLKVGDKLNEGDRYGEIETAASGSSSAVDRNVSTKPEDQKQETIILDDEKTETVQEPVSDSNITVGHVESSGSDIKIITDPDLGGADQVDDIKPSGKVHAGPAVRKLSREFGVDLSLVKGNGVRERVTKDDVQNYVKNALQNPTVSGSGIPKVATIDFSKFGEIETTTLNKIKLATAKNMTAAWLNVPQVTHFDQADITELEAFRKQINSTPNMEKKLSAVPFVMKALASAMKEFPQFNASLSSDGQSLIYKKYLNIGVAVDTPNGLLVPVVRDVDKKSITEIAKDLTDKANKAREGKLMLADMQGGCLSVSSLGGIGGTAFTPIVNAPEVAILGLSRAEIKPEWNGIDFAPKLMLPLSLSYDHRVIDGAEAARFSQRLALLLKDIRHLIL